jgi:hypothetical protein
MISFAFPQKKGQDLRGFTHEIYEILFGHGGFKKKTSKVWILPAIIEWIQKKLF